MPNAGFHIISYSIRSTNLRHQFRPFSQPQKPVTFVAFQQGINLNFFSTAMDALVNHAR
jgi:hypothetical protein